VASLFLARRMVTPIQALQAGAARIGAGELGHRIEIRTGDELEALAAQFNSTTEQLQESYATLERKVEERTRELSESLEQQTATAEILRVISSSPTDIQPVPEGVAIGAITIRRTEVRPFTEKQIALLTTFADQAVIAIENVRLFKELQERNSALTQALDQQTATSEILRVISSSPTDVQPVFDTIVRNAVRLCDGFFGAIFQRDGNLIRLVAKHNFSLQGSQEAEKIYPLPM